MNTSFDITDIDCAPKELEDALGVSGRTLFDPSEHPIHVDIWDGKAYVTLTEMIELEGDALCHFLAIVFPASPSAGPYADAPTAPANPIESRCDEYAAAESACKYKLRTALRKRPGQ